MKRYPRRLNVFLCLLTAFSSHFISPALADEKAKRVLILPLTIHSEKDLTFLNKGIMEMMAPCTDVTQVKSRKGSSNRSLVYLESSGDRAILMYHHREGESLFLVSFVPQKIDPTQNVFSRSVHRSR